MRMMTFIAWVSVLSQSISFAADHPWMDLLLDNTHCWFETTKIDGVAHDPNDLCKGAITNYHDEKTSYLFDERTNRPLKFLNIAFLNYDPMPSGGCGGPIGDDRTIPTNFYLFTNPNYYIEGQPRSYQSKGKYLWQDITLNGHSSELVQIEQSLQVYNLGGDTFRFIGFSRFRGTKTWFVDREAKIRCKP